MADVVFTLLPIAYASGSAAGAATNRRGGGKADLTRRDKARRNKGTGPAAGAAGPANLISRPGVYSRGSATMCTYLTAAVAFAFSVR